MPRMFSVFFCFLALILVWSMACGGSDGPLGEPESDRTYPSIGSSSSEEDDEIMERFVALTEREAEVEDGLCNHEEIDEIWEGFGGWQEDRYGNRLSEDDFLELSDREKKIFLDRFGYLLDDLENAGRKVC